ncbi:MAG: hypothetical protein M3270_02640 [Thermoproteota archaeon]|nr:hypothetical protein [Thermoproteota archaeon]
MLVKSAATLDTLTKRRVNLRVVVTGAFCRAIIGYGEPSRTPTQAVDTSEEEMQII